MEQLLRCSGSLMKTDLLLVFREYLLLSLREKAFLERVRKRPRHVSLIDAGVASLPVVEKEKACDIYSPLRVLPGMLWGSFSHHVSYYFFSSSVPHWSQGRALSSHFNQTFIRSQAEEKQRTRLMFSAQRSSVDLKECKCGMLSFNTRQKRAHVPRPRLL